MPGSKQLFVDEEFPPNASSLGEISLLDAGFMNLDSVEWYRVHEVLGCDWESKPLLIEDGISPRDINQGTLGNCWLLGGLACIAQRHPELIESRFASPRDPETGKPTISTTGRYVIQLWDMRQEAWVDIAIDDTIPCLPPSGGNPKPLFAEAEGNEAWLLLMEKAFAKYFGSYAALEGGSISVVFKVIGGDLVEDYMSYQEPTGMEPWIPGKSTLLPTRTDDGSVCLASYRYHHKDATKALSTVKMFQKLRSWIKSPDCDFILGAGSKGDSDKDHIEGIVSCHAYAILDVVVVPGATLLQLANPHGTGCREWTGTWSNTDTKTWKEHPEVAEACGWTGNNGKGIFWMDAIDFDRHFDEIYVARVPKDCEAAALAKLSGAGGAQVEPLLSGEWEGESEWETDNEAESAAEQGQEAAGEQEEADEGVEQQEEEEGGEGEQGGAEESEEESEEELSPREALRRSARQVFDQYADGRGTLYREELLSVLASLTGTSGFPRKLANQLLGAVGLSVDSQVSFAKLMQMVALLPEVCCFMRYDKDGSGSLTPDELQAIAKELEDSRLANKGRKTRAATKLLGYVTGGRQSDIQARVEDLLSRHDQDDDGEISFREFIGLFNNLGLE